MQLTLGSGKSFSGKYAFIDIIMIRGVYACMCLCVKWKKNSKIKQFDYFFLKNVYTYLLQVYQSEQKTFHLHIIPAEVLIKTLITIHYALSPCQTFPITSLKNIY